MYATQVPTKSAIESTSSHEEVEINRDYVYAAYVSGGYNRFFASEEEAVEYCDNPENGVEFNGTWYPSQYSIFSPGELFRNQSGYVYITWDKSAFLEPIATGLDWVHWDLIP